jgi:ERCC4-type nuclease
MTLVTELTERKVLCDDREPKEMDDKIRALGLKVERVHMDSGDYCVGNILIERKQVDDYFTTLNQGRLFDQLHLMSKTGKRNILLVVGSYPRSHAIKKIPYKTTMALLNNMKRVVFIAFGVLMEIVENEEEFLKYIADCWQRAYGETYAPVAKKEETPEGIKRVILSAIPGIGARSAEYLSHNYKLKQLMNMPDEEITTILINGRKLGDKGKNIKVVFDY